MQSVIGGGAGWGGGRSTATIANFLKRWVGTGHQICRSCLKLIQLGQATVSVWKQ